MKSEQSMGLVARVEQIISTAKLKVFIEPVFP